MNYPKIYTLDECVQELVNASHGAASEAGWWDREKTWETVPRCLMLIVSEVAEAMEGDRKDSMDDKLPHRKMLEVELADAMIRIADLAGALDLDLGGAIVEKMEFNANRADHKKENRSKSGGKNY
jgi:NTP pyrophosphatase (non-canonical NTP hydrolase)